MARLSEVQYYMSIAEQVARRAECPKRSVGSVIIDRHGNILSTGMNGLAPGAKCKDICTNGCMASHSEISALVRLEKPFEATTIYVTCEPCQDCTRAIMLTSIDKVIFRDKHKKSGKALWEKSGKTNWLQLVTITNM